MEKRKNSVWGGIVGLVLLVAILVASFWQAMYISYHPYIRIGKYELGVEGETYYELPMIATAQNTGVTTAPEVEENISALSAWTREMEAEITETYTTPRDVRLSGEVQDGKTTVRFSGYVTTKDGKKIDFEREKTFDFVLVSNDELF